MEKIYILNIFSQIQVAVEEFELLPGEVAKNQILIIITVAVARIKSIKKKNYIVIELV